MKEESHVLSAVGVVKLIETIDIPRQPFKPWQAGKIKCFSPDVEGNRSATLYLETTKEIVRRFCLQSRDQ